MKIESCGKDDLNIFINRQFIGNIDFESKDEIMNFITDFIGKVKDKLRMRGFYKIRVYPNYRIGIFLDIIKLDDVDLSNSLDLRVIITSNEKIYFETEEYDLIATYNDKRYMNGFFYCVIDDCIDDLFEMVEFGRFIYGKEVINLLNNSTIL